MNLFYVNYKTWLHVDTNINEKLNPSHGAILKQQIILFDTYDDADEFISRITLVKPYKDKHIVKVFKKDTLTDVFINKNNWRIYKFNICYEFAENVDTLKAKIDYNQPQFKKPLFCLG